MYYACHCVAVCKAPKFTPQWHGTAMAVRIDTAKVQGFRKVDFIGRRWEDSPIYSLYTGRGQLCSIVCNPRVLAGKGLIVTPLSGVLFSARQRTPLKFVWHWR